MHIERLFLAVMLPPDAAVAASNVLEDARGEYGLTGSPIRQDRLHITPIHVGDPGRTGLSGQRRFAGTETC